MKREGSCNMRRGLGRSVTKFLSFSLSMGALAVMTGPHSLIVLLYTTLFYVYTLTGSKNEIMHADFKHELSPSFPGPAENSF